MSVGGVMGDLRGRSRFMILVMLGAPLVLVAAGLVERRWIMIGTGAALLAVTLSTPGTRQRHYTHLALGGAIAAGWIIGFLNMSERGRGPLIAYAIIAVIAALFLFTAWPRIRREERERASELAELSEADQDRPES